MKITLKLAPHRDQGSGGSGDDPVFDLFSGGGSRHFDPIDEDEDEQLPKPQPAAHDDVADVEPDAPSFQELPLPAASGDAPETTRGRPERSGDSPRAAKTPPRGSGDSKKSQWQSLAESLGLEPAEAPPAPDRPAHVPPTAAPAPRSPAVAPRQEKPAPTDDSWKRSIAELFQIDPAEIPDRPELPEPAVDTQAAEEPESALELETDLDADFVEFEVRDLSPSGESPRSAARPDRREPRRGTGQREPRRDRARSEEREGGRSNTARPAQRSAPDSSDRPAPRRQPEEASASRRPPRPERKKAPPPPTSSGPASADMMHDSDDYIETPDDEQSKRVTSWAEAIDVIVTKNLSSRRPGSSGGNGGRRPRSDRRR